jgi:hypothetical protein
MKPPKQDAGEKEQVPKPIAPPVITEIFQLAWDSAEQICLKLFETQHRKDTYVETEYQSADRRVLQVEGRGLARLFGELLHDL